MVRRRRAPYPGPARAASDPEAAETVTHPTETSEASAQAPALAIETHEASVHDALLETVSVEALQSHDDAATEYAPGAIPEPEEEGAVDEPVPAIDATPISVADDSVPGVVDHVIAEPASIVTPMLPAPTNRRELALEALGALSETNAVVVGFLRSEGTATLEHWRSLASAKSPADAIRLQVDELQRAADASITCFSTLARRAGRLTGLLNRN